MRLHHLLPLVALALNVCLAAVCLLRDPRSRLNRVFGYFVSAMALWNFGVFMLRRAPDPTSARAWEVVIHVGVIAVPALAYHFIAIFLDESLRRRRWLVAAYVLSAGFGLVNVSGSSLFMNGVQQTVWGWAPVPGPVYHLFLLYFYAFLLAGLAHLRAAYRGTASGFRRNRILLILLGTALTIGGGFIDIVRFALARTFPELELVYPLGIPANMACALMFGVAIVRYRMFGVSLIVRKAAVYGTVGAAVTAVLVALTWSLEETFALQELTAIWIIAPLGFLFTLLLTPLGRPVEDWIERLIFSKPRGCHRTLVDLTKRLSTMLQFRGVVDGFVQGLVRGIPLTHAALLVYDEPSATYTLLREETTTGERVGVTAIRQDSRLLAWLQRRDGVLVKEDLGLSRSDGNDVETAWGELKTISASVIVPLRSEGRITGIALIGEKVSGDIFDAVELELLSVLANEAAIAIENARLYERAERERRQLEVLYELARRLVTVEETDALFTLIVDETSRLLGVDFAALRLLDGDDLVLKARIESRVASAQRPRLKLGESLTGQVVMRNEPVIVSDVLVDPRYDPTHRQAAEAAGLHGFLGVPIRSGGAAVGALYVFTTTRRQFSPDEVSLLGALADQAAVALEKARLSAERTRAEEALRQSEKLATMGQLLAGVAHELNNPLTVIVGYAALFAARLAGGPLEGPARQVETAAERCSRIVRNFLALARKRPPERQRITLNQVVTEAVELLAYPLGLDGVETRLDLAGDVPLLWADPHQLQQVVVNLLTNAHHAMRQAPVRRLSISTRYDTAGGRAVLRVADTGPGIPREVRARIFEPFFTTKPIGQGTGLGLSICHGIIANHGGMIRVENEPEGGAVFVVELPLGHERVDGAEADASAAPATGAKRVLIVDDEPAVADLLAQMLALDGHRADTAPSAHAALERLERGRYDLVISDMRMPDIDGPSFYREIERRQAVPRPRFVFMTGDVLGAETVQFLEATRAPCLSKPFAVDELRRTIHAAFIGS